MFRLIAAAVLFISAALAFAGEENFVRLSRAKWEAELPGPGSGAHLLDKEIILIHRGRLLSKEEWKGGTISFKWKPSPAKLADDKRTYGEHLCVFVLSDGTFKEARSYEILTGIVVRLDSVTGDCYVQKAIDGTSFETIKMTKGTKPIDPEIWHDVKITSGGVSISVELDGKEAVSKAEIPKGARKGAVWGFYGREAVGPVPHSSRLKELRWDEVGWKAELLND